MRSVRDALGRYSQSAGQPPELDDVLRVKTRRHRRRRAGGFAIGAAFAAIAAISVIELAGSDSTGAPGPVGASGNETAAPATTPYLWPENWASVNGDRDIQELEAKIRSGDPDVQWRLDPETVIEMFAQEVLGWPEISIAGQQSATTTQWWEISCDAVECDSSWRQLVRIDRLPTSGAWVITSIEAAPLSTGLEHGMNNVAVEDVATTIVGEQEITLAGFDGDLGTIGVVTYDGCSLQRTIRSSLSPGTYSLAPDPSPAAPGCLSTSAGYLFAYASTGGSSEANPTSAAIEFAGPGLTLTPVMLP